MATLAAALKREGWHLREEILAAMLNDLSVGGTPQLGSVQAALKDADLREVGAASLPDDVNRATNKQLDGIRVLQVRMLIARAASGPRIAGLETDRIVRILKVHSDVATIREPTG